MQKRDDKNKLYSLHAPEVECIAKGKAHKKYEFGCKVSVATTSKDNFILGVQAFHSRMNRIRLLCDDDSAAYVGLQ